eukprot:2305609-Pleurochrysis_carterae.AAC.1
MRPLLVWTACAIVSRVCVNSAAVIYRNVDWQQPRFLRRYSWRSLVQFRNPKKNVLLLLDSVNKTAMHSTTSVGEQGCNARVAWLA